MKNRILQTAYHESGHIILAYLTGYEVLECEVLQNGDGKTTFEYGKDLLLIAAITNCKEEPEMFNELPKEIKVNCLTVSNKIISILLAGSVAESMFLNNGVIDENMNVEISGPDLIRSENVDHFLSEIKKEQHDSNYIQNNMTELFNTMNITEVRKSVSELAERLLAKKKISQNEIEDILKTTGFLDALKAS